MNPIVEFCISNFKVEIMYIINLKMIQTFLEYGCLQNCGICSSGLYALVNGDIVEGESPDDLLQKYLFTYRRNMDF